MPQVMQSQTRDILRCSSDKRISSLANDAALVASLTAVFNASLEIAEKFPQTKGELATAIARKGLAVSGAAATASSSRELELMNFGATQTLKSIGLRHIAGMTPNRAAMFITLTTAEKVVSAAGVAGFEKCKMAIGTLAVSSGAATFICVGSLGIGCIAGAIAVAAEAFNVYGQCHAPPE